MGHLSTVVSLKKLPPRFLVLLTQSFQKEGTNKNQVDDAPGGFDRPSN